MNKRTYCAEKNFCLVFIAYYIIDIIDILDIFPIELITLPDKKAQFKVVEVPLENLNCPHAVGTHNIPTISGSPSLPCIHYVDALELQQTIVFVVSLAAVHL